VTKIFIIDTLESALHLPTYSAILAAGKYNGQDARQGTYLSVMFLTWWSIECREVGKSA
jgi:hypothetical protein